MSSFLYILKDYYYGFHINWKDDHAWIGTIMILMRSGIRRKNMKTVMVASCTTVVLFFRNNNI